MSGGGRRRGAQTQTQTQTQHTLPKGPGLSAAWLPDTLLKKKLVKHHLNGLEHYFIRKFRML
jgi:hypothetical protein